MEVVLIPFRWILNLRKPIWLFHIYRRSSATLKHSAWSSSSTHHPTSPIPIQWQIQVVLPSPVSSSSSICSLIVIYIKKKDVIISSAYRLLHHWQHHQQEGSWWQMKLKLAGNVKNNRKGFYRYISQKKKSKETISPLTNEKGELATTDKTAEILSEPSLWGRLPMSPVSLNLWAGVVGAKYFPL